MKNSLTQRVNGEWPGTTMHSLVQWRAMHRDQIQQWQWWYINFMLAVCLQLTVEDHRPQFRRHLIVHLPDVSNIDLNRINVKEMGEVFIWKTLAAVHYREGRWEEAERLQVQVMEAYKAKLDEDHSDTLRGMSHLAWTYLRQDRLEEAESLRVYVMEAYKTKLGEDHPDTLLSKRNLAVTYWEQGRWEEAEQLEVQVMEASKTKLSEDHPDTLRSMANLAMTWKSQDRHADAAALMTDCCQRQERVLGSKHRDALSSLATLEEWSSEETVS